MMIVAVAMIGCGSETKSSAGAPATPGDASKGAVLDVQGVDAPALPETGDAFSDDSVQVDTAPPVEDTAAPPPPPPPDASPVPDVPATAASFQVVFDQVIAPNGCTSGYCHGGGAGGLAMQDRTSA